MTVKRVLIAYGTRYGSTAIIASEIKDFLDKQGYEVEVLDLKNSKNRPDPDLFDLIIIGSSVAMFRWVAKVKRFLKKIKNSKKPLVIYVSAGTAIDDIPQAQLRFVDEVIKKIGVKPVISIPFAPVLDFRNGSKTLSPLKGKKMLTIGVKEMTKERFDENGLMDLRDKVQFENFLKDLGDLL